MQTFLKRVLQNWGLFTLQTNIIFTTLRENYNRHGDKIVRLALEREPIITKKLT